jgi:hypothetical protein
MTTAPRTKEAVNMTAKNGGRNKQIRRSGVRFAFDGDRTEYGKRIQGNQYAPHRMNPASEMAD